MCDTDVYKVYLSDYSTIFYQDAIGNCKHCYLDQVSSFASLCTPKAIERVAKVLHAAQKVTFSINVTSKLYVENLAKYFILISCVAIPTGYGYGFQYFATYFTKYQIRNRDGYVARFKQDGIAKEIILKRKKKGILTIKQLIKLGEFTSKSWLKKYLLKIIS